jgi:hypothetical protein
MAPADAHLLWLSAKVPNDQFLLYAFDGAATESGVAELVRRAAGCPELSLRVVEGRWWRYPRWEPSQVQAEQFAVHDGGDWQACLDVMSALPQLDTARMPWRVHVFGQVTGVPGAGVGAVVVVQMSHALGDGTRAADLAAVLLGRSTELRPVRPPDRGLLPWRAMSAARAHRRLVADTDTGRLPPPLGTRPVSSVNAGGGSAYLRTLVVERERLSHPTVTVGALTAVAEALGGYLDERGEDISQLGAEVPMAAGTGPELAAHNNFRSVGVGLYPRLGTRERAQRIAAELAAQRRRAKHPAVAASDAAFAAVPAALLRWGAGRFDPGVRPARVSGHTVVSSVNRGRADLSFSGHRVVLTAGFPALSPMMGLTHGVHGIGDTVAISVHGASGAVDVDGYCDRLAHALGRHP